MEIPIVKYDESVTSGNKDYFKVGYQYNGTISEIGMNEWGYVSLTIKTDNGISTEYTQLSVNSNSTWYSETINKWAQAVIESNTTEGDQRDRAFAGMKTSGVDVTKWKGYKIAFVCSPSFNKDETKNKQFASPSYAVPYNKEKEGVCVNATKYNEWVQYRADHRYTDSVPSDVKNTSSATAMAPAIDDDLPF